MIGPAMNAAHYCRGHFTGITACHWLLLDQLARPNPNLCVTISLIMMLSG